MKVYKNLQNSTHLDTSFKYSPSGIPLDSRVSNQLSQLCAKKDNSHRNCINGKLHPLISSSNGMTISRNEILKKQIVLIQRYFVILIIKFVIHVLLIPLLIFLFHLLISLIPGISNITKQNSNITEYISNNY